MYGFASAKRSDKMSQQKSATPGTSSFVSNQRQQIREALSYNGAGQDKGEVIQKQDAVQRQVEEEEEELLQPKFADNEMSVPQQYKEDNVPVSTSPGAMPGSLRAGLEALSDMDLSATRVHMNSAKPAEVNALAYTQGQDIYVGPGQEQHLPHEGWHVVQQLQGRVTPSREVNGQSINDDHALEHEADVMGEKAAGMSLPGAQPRPASAVNGSIAQHKCEQCEQQDEPITQTKSIANISSANPAFKIDGFTSVRGVSLPTSIQRQADDDIGEQDPQKKAEYDGLQPQEGGGSASGAATLAGGGANENDAVQLKASDVVQRVNCTPANTGLGNNALSFAERTRSSWRSHVTYRANVDNESDHLKIRMYVFAKV